jgi:cell division protein FtsW
VRKPALFWFGLVVTALVALGLVVLSSASEANAMRLHGDAYYFIKRQFVYLVVGVLLAVAVSMFDYHKWRDWEVLTWIFFAVVMVLLVAVFGFRAINGSHRWIAVGPIRIQPSELAKLLTVIVVAVWLDKASWKVELFMRGALGPATLIGIISLPVLLEPDFGSVMVIGSLGFLLMFVGGTRILHMIPFAVCGVGIVVFKILTNANRVARLFDESKEYQVKMALAAIANADIWGAGLGESMQKHLYLPEAHTDFVFAVGAEELGIVFSVATVLLFLAFFALSVYIARKAQDRFGRFLVVGMTFIIFFQAMFNVGVVCKALPTKGMALPFFSYGGTNLLSAFFAVGTILSVGIHSCREKKHALMRKVFVR